MRERFHMCVRQYTVSYFNHDGVAVLARLATAAKIHPQTPNRDAIQEVFSDQFKEDPFKLTLIIM